jgi:hypothetical protein
MTTEKIQEKVNEAIERELDNHPEVNRTILTAIHSPDNNDAMKVAQIAQNMFALGAGFFHHAYDHLILEQMVEEPFLDIEGNRRAIRVEPSEVGFEVKNGELIISEEVWGSMTLMNEEVKQMVGRYFLGLQVSNKLSQKHAKAINLRLRAEMTAVSDRLNQGFYEYDEEQLRAMALTVSELALKFILPLAPQFCTEEEYAQMFDVAYEAIVSSMDEPSDYPFIRAFNEAAPNALFLDDRAANILRIFRAQQAIIQEKEELRETFPLDYMASCMSLVRF